MLASLNIIFWCLPVQLVRILSDTVQLACTASKNLERHNTVDLTGTTECKIGSPAERYILNVVSECPYEQQVGF